MCWDQEIATGEFTKMTWTRVPVGAACCDLPALSSTLWSVPGAMPPLAGEGNRDCPLKTSEWTAPRPSARARYQLALAVGVRERLTTVSPGVVPVTAAVVAVGSKSCGDGGDRPWRLDVAFGGGAAAVASGLW